MPQEPSWLTTEDGLRLEARTLIPDHPVGATVICHPHPLMDGSMSSVLIPILQRACAGRGLAALRFNFRGVRRSEGRFEGGLGEQRDVRAALAALESQFPGLPLSIAGWSFGSLVALAASAGDIRIARVGLIAPPVSVASPERLPDPPAPERIQGWRARVLAVCGTLDTYSAPQDAEAWGTGMLGDRFSLVTIPDANHAFTGHEAAMTKTIVDHLLSP